MSEREKEREREREREKERGGKRERRRMCVCVRLGVWVRKSVHMCARERERCDFVCVISHGHVK